MFARGSLIATDDKGSTVPVEQLCVGDSVYLTSIDQYTRVTKIQKVVDRKYSAVIVPRGSIWNGVPKRDLVLDADQSVTVVLNDAGEMRAENIQASKLSSVGIDATVLPQAELDYFDIELESYNRLDVEGVIASVLGAHSAFGPASLVA